MSDSNAERPTDSGASAQGEFNQSDIDALFGGGGTGAPGDETPAAPAETSPKEAAQPDASGAVNQDDIDALIASAQDSAGEDQPAAEAPTPAAPDARVDTLGRPFDDAAAAMMAAMEEEKQAAATAEPAPTSAPTPSAAAVETQSFDLDDLGPSRLGVDAKRVTMLNDVNLRVRLHLGQTRMLVEEVLKLDEGSVVELDKLAGDPVDVLVNDRLIARGEVLVLNDNFCVRVSEVLSHDPHRVTT